jgi:hypothetical protein
MPLHISSEEDYGLVRSKVAASTSSTDILAAIASMIADVTLTSPVFTPLRRQHDWRVHPTIASPANCLLLQCVDAGLGGIVNQQQVFIRAETNDIKVGYSPNGGITGFVGTDPVLDPTKSWTGMRSITGTNATWASSPPGARVHLIEYMDFNVVDYGSGASLTILLENPANTGFSYGCHVGRIIVPDNDADYAPLGTPPVSLTGDAMLVGRPDVDHVAESWVYGNFANPDDSSVIRVGNLKWSYFRMVPERGQTQPPTLLAGNAQLRAIKGIYKPVPYSVMGHGRAVAYGANAQSDAAGDGAGRIGQTKYLRLFYYDLEHRAQVSSIAYDSLQSWLGCTAVDIATKRHQAILWSKASVAVP